MNTVHDYGHSVRIEAKEEMVYKLSTTPQLPVAVNWLDTSAAWDYVHSPSLIPPGFSLGSDNAGLRTSRRPEIHQNFEDAEKTYAKEFAARAATYAYQSEGIIHTCRRPNASNVMVHVPDSFSFPADFRTHFAVIPTSAVAVALGYGAHVTEGYCVLEMSGVPSGLRLGKDEGGEAEFGGVDPLELSHTAIQLAAGGQPALDQLTLNIVELKDVPKSIRGVVDFSNFVRKAARGGIKKKASIVALAGAYLTYKYGIAPTADFIHEYLTSLRDQLVNARGVLDSLQLRAFDAIVREDEAKQRYLEWVAERDAQRQAHLYRKQLRKQARDREAEREKEKRAFFRRQRDLLRKLRDSTWQTMEALRADMELQAAKAHDALTALGLRRDTLYELMDEHRSYRETTTNRLWELVQLSRDAKFSAWQELKEHEHLLVWLYSLRARAGEIPFEQVAGIIQSDLYGYEQRYREAVSNLIVAKAQLEGFETQAEEAFLELHSQATDLRRQQEAVISAARENSREMQRQLLELRAQMATLRSELNLLYEQENERIDARKRAIRSKRVYREILRESLHRLRKGPTRGYSLKSLFVSSRRQLSGRERGDALSPLAVQVPSSVTYEATVNSGQGECLGACIERTFQEHLRSLIRKDVRTLHHHLVYRQWAVADALSACLDSVGRVVDYLYTFVQPITTAWNLVPFSFVVDWGADFSTVTKNLESMVMAAVSTAQPSEAWDVHKLTPVYGDNWSSWLEPFSVEAQWIDQPGSFRRTHRVRITLSDVWTDIDYRASENECALRYPFSLSGLGAIIPPTSLEKFFNHALEIGALVATITK